MGRAGGLHKGVCSEWLLLPALHICQIPLTHGDSGHPHRRSSHLADPVPRLLPTKHPPYQPRSSTTGDFGFK